MLFNCPGSTNLQYAFIVMKTVLIAFALTCPLACHADPVMRTAAKRIPLQGRVKTVRYSDYGALTDKQAETMSSNKDRYSVDSYSSNGLKLYYRYIENGIVVYDVTYKYNDANKLTEESGINKQDDNTWTNCTKFTYDASGNLTEEIAYGTCDKDPGISTQYTYINGRLVNKKRGDLDSTNYFYNDKGQVVKEDRYYHHGNEPVTTKYTYDGYGKMVTETTVFGMRLSRTTAYTYDDNGNEVLAEEHMDDGAVYRQFTSWYIYDSHGNWTRCVEDLPDDFPEGPPPKGLYIREIVYY